MVLICDTLPVDFAVELADAAGVAAVLAVVFFFAGVADCGLAPVDGVVVVSAAFALPASMIVFTNATIDIEPKRLARGKNPGIASGFICCLFVRPDVEFGDRLINDDEVVMMNASRGEKFQNKNTIFALGCVGHSNHDFSLPRRFYNGSRRDKVG